MLSAGIFKAYDIRGIAGVTLTEEGVEAIGQAIGSEGLRRGQTSIAVGRDGRLSGPVLIAALVRGLLKSGMDVIDVGCVATPLVYFAAYALEVHSAVILTGSHNPSEYNGLKIVLGGETLYGDAIQALRLSIEQGELLTGCGRYTQQDISATYIERIASDVRLARPMHILIDCGNGVAGAHAAALYRRLGCTVDEMYCEVDGNFPHHHPDPSDPRNLADMIEALKSGRGELGLAFDGDGDRLGVVTTEGNIIYPDRQLMLFADDLLLRNPGAQVIFDVKCTRHLFGWIASRGGVPLMWKTGHSLVKAKMKETGALLAGEMTGHLFFTERWYGFDDGLYAGARLLEILSASPDASRMLNALPDAFSTPELLMRTAEGEAHALLDSLVTDFEGAREIIRIDGLRVEYADGFGLARASNTTPAVVMRFEADSQDALTRIQQDFRRVFVKAAPHLVLPF